MNPAAISDAHIPASRQTYPIFMSILATQHARSSRMRVVVPRGRDINEQPTRRVNPSCIDNIESIRLFAIEVVWVDLQHVIPSFWYPRRPVVENGHVVV